MSERLRETVALCAAMPRTVEDLCDALGLRRAMAYRHVARGVELGVLERYAPLRGTPALIAANREGQRWSGSGLETARLSPGLVAHWISCSRAAIALEIEYPDRRVISETELRMEEAIAGKAIASAVVGEREDGRPRLHRPDLVVIGEGRPLAVEVELTPKAPARLERIVRGWRKARCVEGIRYYVASGRTRRGLERAIERSAAEERVELRDAGSLR
jgi:hypothetical protein